MADKALTVLEVRVPRLEQKPREGDFTPESMEGFLSGMAASVPSSIVDKIITLVKPPLHRFRPIALELTASESAIHFCLAISPETRTYTESQMGAAYPKAIIIDTKDYLNSWDTTNAAVGELKLTAAPFYPLKNWQNFDQADPLAQVLGVMNRAGPLDKLLVQIVIAPAGNSWTQKGWSVIQAGIATPEGKSKANPQERTIKEKLSETGFKTAIRLLAIGQNPESSRALLTQLAGSFAAFGSQDGNSFKLSVPTFSKSKLLHSILTRSAGGLKQIVTAPEIATIFHPPGYVLAQTPNLSWANQVVVEPPTNLPIAKDMSDQEKQKINFIGRVQYRNAISTFGIKREDRRRHIYIIGKSGTGKTTLIANMAVADMRNGEGVGLIDPHGDLCDKILDYIPSHRLNDVIYLDPSDVEHPFHINILELKSSDMMNKNLVVSGIVAVFNKLYAYSWGPRLEYILRNAVATLVEVQGTTLVQLPDLLSNDAYRAKIIDKLQDPVLRNFWLFEYNKADARTRSEWISPILNKVGQFISSPVIRMILENPHSTIDLERAMNEGKIVILNLSQGKIGEDNATLLGAMFITKFQLYAMNRAHIPEDNRRDFFLYVDEFQNFATESFAKILSEARKYRLDLTVANQYIGQVPEELQKAIFGNVGTIISFVVGAQDAHWLFKEFNELYKESDLVSLGMFQIVIKMTIEGLIARPFTATTLPLPKSKNQNREKVIRLSREKFTKTRVPSTS